MPEPSASRRDLVAALLALTPVVKPEEEPEKEPSEEEEPEKEPSGPRWAVDRPWAIDLANHMGEYARQQEWSHRLAEDPWWRPTWDAMWLYRATAALDLPVTGDDEVASAQACVEQVAGGLLRQFIAHLRGTVYKEAARARRSEEGRARKPRGTLDDPETVWAERLRADPTRHAVALLLAEMVEADTVARDGVIANRVIEAGLASSVGGAQQLVMETLKLLYELRPPAPAWADRSLLAPLRDRGVDLPYAELGLTTAADPGPPGKRPKRDYETGGWAGPVRDDPTADTVIRTLLGFLDRRRKAPSEPMTIIAKKLAALGRAQDAGAALQRAIELLRTAQPAEDAWVDVNIVRPLDRRAATGGGVMADASLDAVGDAIGPDRIYAGSPWDLDIEVGVPLSVDISSARRRLGRALATATRGTDRDMMRIVTGALELLDEAVPAGATGPVMIFGQLRKLAEDAADAAESARDLQQLVALAEGSVSRTGDGDYASAIYGPGAIPVVSAIAARLAPEGTTDADFRRLCAGILAAARWAMGRGPIKAGPREAARPSH